VAGAALSAASADMSAQVIPFRDPAAPLEGKSRDAAREACRARLKVIALKAVCDAFSAFCEVPEASQLSVNDTVPMFVAAMREQLAKSGY
jgi:hypothetical protein